jgi:hypothetical protein
MLSSKPCTISTCFLSPFYTLLAVSSFHFMLNLLGLCFIILLLVHSFPFTHGPFYCPLFLSIFYLEDAHNSNTKQFLSNLDPSNLTPLARFLLITVVVLWILLTLLHLPLSYLSQWSYSGSHHYCYKLHTRLEGCLYMTQCVAGTLDIAQSNDP